MKRRTIEELDECDGLYNVAKFVELPHPWVSEEVAAEIIEMVNSHADWLLQEVNKTKETN